MAAPSPLPTVSHQTAGPAGRTEGRFSRVAMMVSIDAATSKAHLCLLPSKEGEGNVPKQAVLALDGTLSAKAVKQALRELGWRAQRGNSVFVVVPSEESLMLVEEFPTADSNEAVAMADGLVKGMVELEPGDHVHSVAVLHHGVARTSCAIAVFQRERLEQLFGFLQKLGIRDARFVLDVMGLWQISEDAASDGYWGWVVKDASSSRGVAKALKVRDGVIRAVRQQFFQGAVEDVAFWEPLGGRLFPEEAAKGSPIPVSWHLAQRSMDSPPHLGDFCRLAASGRIVCFEMQPDFWKTQLKRQSARRQTRWAVAAVAACYLLFILYLGGLSFLQWRNNQELRRTSRGQEAAYREAMEIKRRLAAVHASQNPGGTVLEVLRQIVEVMPEGMIFENFSFRFSESVKLRGTSARSEAVYDFVGQLRKNPCFKNAKVDSMGANQPGGAVTWQIVIPLQAPSPTTSPS